MIYVQSGLYGHCDSHISLFRPLLLYFRSTRGHILFYGMNIYDPFLSDSRLIVVKRYLTAAQETVPRMYSRKCLLQMVGIFPCTQYCTVNMGCLPHLPRVRVSGRGFGKWIPPGPVPVCTCRRSSHRSFWDPNPVRTSLYGSPADNRAYSAGNKTSERIVRDYAVRSYFGRRNMGLDGLRHPSKP